MKVLLLAAGYGTRLQPLTNTIPKCLVPIKEKVLLDIWLDNLSYYGFGPFIVNTHYLHEQVEKHIQKSNYSEKVKLVYEHKLKGTAGTLLDNIEFIDSDNLLLAHADNYCSPDFSKFEIAHNHRPNGCLMTMMTFRTNSPSSCGIVELDSRGVVVEFYEKVDNPPSNLANGAIYILSSEFIDILRKDFKNCSDFSTEILPYFMNRIFTYESKGFFIDIGTPDAYKLANQ